MPIHWCPDETYALLMGLPLLGVLLARLKSWWADHRTGVPIWLVYRFDGEQWVPVHARRRFGHQKAVLLAPPVLACEGEHYLEARVGVLTWRGERWRVKAR